VSPKPWFGTRPPFRGSGPDAGSRRRRAAVGNACGGGRYWLPPLLDRELFSGDPEVSGAQISPDGKFIAFLKPLDEIRNIWVKNTDEPFDTR